MKLFKEEPQELTAIGWVKTRIRPAWPPITREVELLNPPIIQAEDEGCLEDDLKELYEMTVTDLTVEHPKHYGGESSPFEAIKIIEHFRLGFHLGNVVKYLLRAGKKDDYLQDLQKARWYLDRYIAQEVSRRESEKV